MLFGGDTEPGCEVSGAGEMSDRSAGGGSDRGGAQQANAWNRHEQFAGAGVVGSLGERALGLCDTGLEHGDLIEEQTQSRTQQLGQCRLLIGDSAADGFNSGASAHGDVQSELATETA